MALAACSLWRGVLPPSPDLCRQFSRVRHVCPGRRCLVSLLAALMAFLFRLGPLAPLIHLGDHLGAGLGSAGPGLRGRGRSSTCLQRLFSHPHLCFGTSSPGGSAPSSPAPSLCVAFRSLCVARLPVC